MHLFYCFVSDEEDVDVLPLELFQVEDEQQMANLDIVLRKTPEVVLYFLQHNVFNKVMQHQFVKLQASGVDLGGDMLFGLLQS